VEILSFLILINPFKHKTSKAIKHDVLDDRNKHKT